MRIKEFSATLAEGGWPPNENSLMSAAEKRHMATVRDDICNGILLFSSLLALPALFSVSVREESFLEDFSSWVFSIACILLWAAVLLRKRIPVGLKAFFIAATSLILSFVTFMDTGILGGGKVWLLNFSVISVLLYSNYKVAGATLLTGVFLLLGIAMAYRFNLVTMPDIDLTHFHSRESPWIALFFTYLMLGSMLSVAIVRLSKEHEKLWTDLRQRSDELERVLNVAPAPIFSVDQHGGITFWNSYLQKITDYSSSDVMNIKSTPVTDPSGPFVTGLFSHELELEALTGQQVEVTLKSKSDQLLDMVFSVTSLLDEHGVRSGLLFLGQDVTDLKNREKQLLQSEKLATLGEMSTGIAHEINQPLNTIKLMAKNLSLLLERSINQASIDDIDKFQYKLDGIGKQVDRAAIITDHMRILGRSASDSFIKYEKFDVTDAINACKSLMEGQLRLLSIALSLEIDEQPLMVDGSSLELEQVLLNLVRNSRDAITESTDQGSIVISARLAAKEIIIAVADDGPGFSPMDEHKLFDPFFSTKDVGKGTGLGLSISHRMIARMEGTLTAHNASRGAVFEIRFPRSPQG